MRAVRTLAACATVLVCVACGPTASTGGTVAPTGGNGPAPGPQPAGAQGGNSVEELKLRLDGFVNERQGLVEPASTDSGVCEDLCSLASSICDVKDKLCQISEERADQAEYRDLCREAQLECKDAQDSCINCVQGHSNSTQPAPQ